MAYPIRMVLRLACIVPFQGHFHTPPGRYSRWAQMVNRLALIAWLQGDPLLRPRGISDRPAPYPDG